MRRLLTELVVDDRGQDLVEYVLLTATFGLLGAAAWPLFVDAFDAVYDAANIRPQEVWEVPDPQ